MHSLLYYSADPQITIPQLKKQQLNPEISLEKIEKYMQEHDLQGTLLTESEYPERLKAFSEAPYLFYYQGDLSLLQRRILGIVGPREPSPYALQVMQAFFQQGQGRDFVTISGFARGIDQEAHLLSLKYQIPTIAVLGGGFQHYLKSADRHLLKQIVEHWGLVLSQFKIGFEPTKWSFPARNKFLAQLADLLFLPEAKSKSGSLITANFAHKFGKEVFSVPAPIFAEHSSGIFEQMNADKIKLVSDFWTFFAEHFAGGESNTIKKVEKADLSLLPPLQQQICQHLAQWASNIESLAHATQLQMTQLMQEITLLEMDNLIKESSPGIYQLK